jgi:hypothetical protein
MTYSRKQVVCDGNPAQRTGPLFFFPHEGKNQNSLFNFSELNSVIRIVSFVLTMQSWFWGFLCCCFYLFTCAYIVWVISPGIYMPGTEGEEGERWGRGAGWTSFLIGRRRLMFSHNCPCR